MWRIGIPLDDEARDFGVERKAIYLRRGDGSIVNPKLVDCAGKVGAYIVVPTREHVRPVIGQRTGHGQAVNESSVHIQLHHAAVIGSRQMVPVIWGPKCRGGCNVAE